MNMDIAAFKAWAAEQLSQTKFSEEDKADILENTNSIFELADQQKEDGTKGADGKLNKQELANAQAFFKSALSFVELFSPKEKEENKTQNEDPFAGLNGYNIQKHPADKNQITIIVNGEAVGVMKNEDGGFMIMRGDGGAAANELEFHNFTSMDELTKALQDPELKFGKYSGLDITEYD